MASPDFIKDSSSVLLAIDPKAHEQIIPCDAITLLAVQGAKFDIATAELTKQLKTACDAYKLTHPSFDGYVC